MKQTYQVMVVVQVEREYSVDAESAELAEEKAADLARSEFGLLDGAHVDRAMVVPWTK